MTSHIRLLLTLGRNISSALLMVQTTTPKHQTWAKLVHLTHGLCNSRTRYHGTKCPMPVWCLTRYSAERRYDCALRSVSASYAMLLLVCETSRGALFFDVLLCGTRRSQLIPHKPHSWQGTYQHDFELPGPCTVVRK
jgi:hypothetical protein